MSSNLAPFCIVPRDLIRKVSATAIVTWCSLHSFADASGECWPKMETICDRSGLSEKTVRKGLAELKKAGRLEIYQRTGTSNCYVLDLMKRGKSDLFASDIPVAPPSQTLPGGASPETAGDPSQNLPLKREPLNETQVNEEKKASLRDAPAVDDPGKISQPQAATTPSEPAKDKPKKEPSWEGLQYPKIVSICPTATGKDGFPLLKTMAQKFTRDTVEKALDKLVEKKMELGVSSLWAVVTEECRRQNDAKVIRKGGGKSAPVSEGLRRGLEFYQPQRDEDPPAEEQQT